MKVKLLTIGAITTLVLGGAISSLHAKSAHLTNSDIGQMCPDYDTNPEQEALENCEARRMEDSIRQTSRVEHPRKTDRNVYNHPQWCAKSALESTLSRELCEKFKIRSDKDFDRPLSNSDSAQFKKMRCPLG